MELKKIKDKMPSTSNSNRKDRRRSVLFYVAVVIVIIGLVDFTIGTPALLSSMFIELQLLALGTIRQEYTFQLWLLFILAAFVWANGIKFVPEIYVPSVAENGESFIYRPWGKWIEGNMRFFKTIRGQIIAINSDIVTRQKFGLHYTVSANVEKARIRTNSRDIIAYQTENIEVEKSVHERKRSEYLMEVVARLYDSLENQDIPFKKEELADLLKSFRREMDEGS